MCNRFNRSPLDLNPSLQHPKPGHPINLEKQHLKVILKYLFSSLGFLRTKGLKSKKTGHTILYICMGVGVGWGGVGVGLGEVDKRQ